jgi:hypothetical protein
VLSPEIKDRRSQGRQLGEAQEDFVFLMHVIYYTGCLKIVSTKKKLWHLEALRNPKKQFLIFLNKMDKVTLSQHILRLRRGSIF